MLSLGSLESLVRSGDSGKEACLQLVGYMTSSSRLSIIDDLRDIRCNDTERSKNACCLDSFGW